MAFSIKDNLSAGYTEYFKAQEYETKLRGDNVMVMMQVGSFLEIYELILEDDDGNEERIGRASEMKHVLQKMKDTVTSSTQKYYNGKKVVSISKYGFPFYEESKKIYITAANNKGFIVPVYYQLGKDPITGIERRECKEVWTPLIRPDSCNETNDQWFIGIVTDYEMDNATMVAVNPLTRTYTMTKVSRDIIRNDVLIQSYDFVSTHIPREIVIWFKGNIEGDFPEKEHIRTVFGISTDAVITCMRLTKTQKPDDNTIKSVNQYISCSNIYSEDATVIWSFDYLRNINPGALKGSIFHKEYNNDHLMVLENQALQQLNILPGSQDSSYVRKKESCVMELTDNTLTAMGKRIHRRWITNPTTSLHIIRERQMIGRWLNDDVDERLLKLRNVLKGMCDMSRLFSSQVVGGVRYSLVWDCVDTIETLIAGIKDIKIPYEFDTESNEQFIKTVRDELKHISELPNQGNTIGGTGYDSYWSTEQTDFPFTEVGSLNVCSGENTLLDIYQTYQSQYCSLQKLVDKLNGIGVTRSTKRIVKGGNGNEIRIVFSNNGGYAIGVYEVKKINLVDSCNTGDIEWKDLKIIKNENSGRSAAYVLDGGMKIHINERNYTLNYLTTQLSQSRRKLEDAVVDYWLVWSKNLRERFETVIRQTIEYIGFMDAIQSASWNIQTKGYIWPDVDEHKDYSSYTVKGLRHPLIESIRQDIKYVSHSIEMGQAHEHIGQLIFGVNSSGKSSLMKAVGISVILAQSGMAVPASEFRIQLFKKLYTRILGNDNLFRGLSTFRVESNELIRILNGADSYSLVLGDELCSGTEQYGAESIVSASILTLLERQTPFVFATHWHRLRDIPVLNRHIRLGWNHLYVETTADGGMYMDRSLRKGAGPRGYAIDFMERMGCSKDVIAKAREIREFISSEIFAVSSAANDTQETSTSDFKTSWNSRANIQTYCQVCNKHPTEETDHIIPRHLANDNGGITGKGSVHNGGNLVGLCSSCHSRKTAGEIIIDGYREYETENGVLERKLIWYESEKDHCQPRKHLYENSIEDPVIENKKSLEDFKYINGTQMNIRDVELDESGETNDIHRNIKRMASQGKTMHQIQFYLRKMNIKMTQREIKSII